MVLTLYKKDTSPPCRSVFMTLHALKIPDNVKFIDVFLPAGEHLTEEYLRMNPQHTIPLLKDNDFLIWDSHAICGYLVSKYGQNDSLYPSEPKKRAVIDQRLHFDSGVLFATLRTTVEPLLYSSDTTFKPENLEKLKNAYGFMEKFLTSKWLAGEDVTLADICCVSTISSMNEILPIEEQQFPKLTAWLTQCSEQDFFKKGNAPNILQFREMIKNKLAEKQRTV
uniref:Glutathione S-transferase epsilon 2 n=1 Tax=Heortia vitessoides TaxID=1557813 RepID=A0A3G1RJ81_9NEOP|nr:glutathione S-transferase epsilon 2 [Heortia vitessoides]